MQPHTQGWLDLSLIWALFTLASFGSGITSVGLLSVITDADADAFVVASRALVGIASWSILSAPVEITLTQHRFMVLLAGLGPQKVSKLAEQLNVGVSNASRLCDRLQRLGLIQRERDTEDGRAVMVSLTDAGRDLLSAVDDFRREEVLRVLVRMSASEIKDAVRALTVFSTRADEVQRKWGWVSE